MTEIPSEHRLESSTSLLREGYTFISARCARLHSDVFQARLLLQNTLCLHGEEAAQLFYDEQRFQRAGAAPRMLLKTLIGQGGVQSLDGEAHRHRKRMFLAVLDDSGVALMVRQMEIAWRQAMAQWPQRGAVSLLEEAHLILTRAVCAWAGVPLAPDEAPQRCAQFVALIEGAGAIGPRHWQARHARKESEAWAGGLIREVRAGHLPVDAGKPLSVVAEHRQLDGTLLDEQIAAVELLNLLRPTVAVARFIAFAGLELHLHPEWHLRLARQDHWLEPFVQEVRRRHAFFPFMAARVRHDFEWKGYSFPAGTRVLLDLYGTNHDPRLWERPEAFRPERFEHWCGNPYSFLTQGGGELETQHRCPGERLTIELTKAAVKILTREIDYRLPEQDLTVDLTHMPAAPASGLLLTGVRLRGD